MVAAVLHLDEGARALGEAGDQMRRGLAHRHDVGDADSARQPSVASWKLARTAVELARALPTTPRRPRASPRSVSGSIWAAQPVTSRRASGRARCALRIAWRVWRTASAVTAQLLTMTRSSSAAGQRAHRLALGDVEPAAEGDDLRTAHRARQLAGEDLGGGAASSGSSRPAPSRSAASPPGSCTSTGLCTSPRRIAATAVAQAPVPQARVRPAPRSQTRSRIASSSIVATLTLTRSGNSGSCSISGPSRVELDRVGRPRRRRRRADCRH